MSNTFPMTSSDPTPFVVRAYLQGQAFGWVRETWINGCQAGASDIRFTTDWVAVRELGVHRRVINDNGAGMSPDELPSFFNTWGGSGQAVGGVNENYGYGAKVSLLPWNEHGVVVLSRRDGVTSMMWMHRSEEGRYGVRALPSDTDIDLMVVELNEWDNYPDPDDPGLDWVEVADQQFGDRVSGTAIVLLGMTGREDTAFEGDPTREESAKFGIAQYVNSRFFNLPVPTIVEPVYPTDRDEWPTSSSQKLERRICHGLSETIEAGTTDGVTRGIVEVPATEGGGLAAKIHWWLTGSEPPTRGDANTIPLFGYRFSSHADVEEIYTLETSGGPRLAAHRE